MPRPGANAGSRCPDRWRWPVSHTRHFARSARHSEVATPAAKARRRPPASRVRRPLSHLLEAANHRRCMPAVQVANTRLFCFSCSPRTCRLSSAHRARVRCSIDMDGTVIRVGSHRAPVAYLDMISPIFVLSVRRLHWRYGRAAWMCAKHVSKEQTSTRQLNDQGAVRSIGDVMHRSDPSVVSVLKRQEAMPIRQVPRAARKRTNDAELRRWQTLDSRASHCCDLSRIVSIVQPVAGHTIAWGQAFFSGMHGPVAICKLPFT